MSEIYLKKKLFFHFLNAFIKSRVESNPIFMYQLVKFSSAGKILGWTQYDLGDILNKNMYSLKERQ